MSHPPPFLIDYTAMKTYLYGFIGIFCMFSLSSCRMKQNKINSQTIKFGQIEFIDTIHHFGNVSLENPIDSFDFKFVNTSDKMVIVLDVKTSCHCTKAIYPHYPIQPGDTSYIRVIYDGTGRKPEYFSKTTRIYTSASDKLISLHIDGQLQ